MSWIKENQFLVSLGALTFGGMAVFGWYGLSGGGRYDEAQEAFNGAASEAGKYEQLKPYPIRENLEAKKVALEDYREATGKLQKAFDIYRPGELTKISPQVFSDRLKQAHEETLAAFGEDLEMPEGYFCGFENYRSALANGEATAILSYQLEAVKKLMLDLAGSGSARLINLHRPQLVEERGQKFVADDGQVARGLPLELTFEAPEESARKFLSSLVGADNQCYVIRSMRIRNAKADPPKHSEVKFEKSTVVAPARTPAAAPNAVFGGGDLSALFSDGADSGGEKPAAAPAPASAPQPTADTSRILSQVLGDENVQVFLRLDIMLVLPEKELP